MTEREQLRARAIRQEMMAAAVAYLVDAGMGDDEARAAAEAALNSPCDFSIPKLP